MKNLFIIFKFELVGFLKNKAFMVSTIIICLIIAIGLSFPIIKNTLSHSFIRDIIGEKTDDEKSEKNMKRYGVIDENNIIHNMDTLKANFADGQLILFAALEDLENQVSEGELDAGYVIHSPTSYEYIIKNNEMYGGNPYVLEDILIQSFRIQSFQNAGIDYTQFEDIMNPTIEVETKILGKDSARNYFYTYILVFSLYFIIILYGQLIATSIASEKSNRAMEVLITSTKSTHLIFGKVLGVALAGIIQFGLILSTSLVAYKFNEVAWSHNLDFIFKIPGSVLACFAIFGILGYLFYAFIYGALGALVSRTEDVSASATPITMLFIGVFMLSIFGMQNTSGLLLKIASFLPFSSFMAMLIRVSMGSVSNLEIFISFVILACSTGFVAILASKIYRAGTLMYGNRIKLTDTFKLLKDN